MNYTDEEHNRLLDAALLITAKALDGKVDHQGKPVLVHVLRVSNALSGDEAIVGMLHDTVEETAEDSDGKRVTLSDLAGVFPSRIVAAVEAITHRKHEPRVEYYKRVADNDLARAVKRVDIDDNFKRLLGVVDTGIRERLERKYTVARQHLFGG